MTTMIPKHRTVEVAAWENICNNLLLNLFIYKKVSILSFFAIVLSGFRDMDVISSAATPVPSFLQQQCKPRLWCSCNMMNVKKRKRKAWKASEQQWVSNHKQWCSFLRLISVRTKPNIKKQEVVDADERHRISLNKVPKNLQNGNKKHTHQVTLTGSEALIYSHFY